MRFKLCPHQNLQVGLCLVELSLDHQNHTLPAGQWSKWSQDKPQEVAVGLGASRTVQREALLRLPAFVLDPAQPARGRAERRRARAPWIPPGWEDTLEGSLALPRTLCQACSEFVGDHQDVSSCAFIWISPSLGSRIAASRNWRMTPHLVWAIVVRELCCYTGTSRFSLFHPSFFFFLFLLSLLATYPCPFRPACLSFLFGLELNYLTQSGLGLALHLPLFCSSCMPSLPVFFYAL